MGSWLGTWAAWFLTKSMFDDLETVFKFWTMCKWSVRFAQNVWQTVEGFWLY